MKKIKFDSQFMALLILIALFIFWFVNYLPVDMAVGIIALFFCLVLGAPSGFLLLWFFGWITHDKTDPDDMPHVAVHFSMWSGFVIAFLLFLALR